MTSDVRHELSFQQFPLLSGSTSRVGAVIAVLVGFHVERHWSYAEEDTCMSSVIAVLVGVHVERHVLPVVVLILIFVLVFILAKVWRERVSQGWRGGKERD